ncbi:MAG: tRNA lysidine(34) synthetase TilS [Anaerolineales bacterium]
MHKDGPRCYNSAAVDAVARVSEFIGREQLLSPGQRVVLGVSGGADSLCLLGSLNQLGYRIVVAHLDHGWRSASWSDALFVLGLARQLGLPSVVERLRTLPSGPTTSLEERGREARYEFLSRVAAQHRAEAVAVGHTADDQTETVVMHWLRGAGPQGLRGILPETEVPHPSGAPSGSPLRLVRPLLELRRGDTEAFCRLMGWEPRQDESNRDRSFLRNRIRWELLPDLEAGYRGFSERVIRSARLMREVSALLDDLAAGKEEDLVHRAGPNALRIARAELNREPVAVQRTILRRALRRLRPDLRDIGFEAVELLLANGASRRSLVGDIRAVRFGQDWLLIGPGGKAEFPGWPQLNDPGPVALGIPGSVILAEGWRLTARRRSLHGQTPRARDGQGGVVIDASLLEGPLEVRTARPGDRIGPLGMAGRIKVADLLSQERIPVPVRAQWPLVVSREEVIWVAGVRMADRVKVTRRTRSAIVLTLGSPAHGRRTATEFSRRAKPPA